MNLIIREVNLDDWKILNYFYNRIYRKNHPLQNQEFWNWQFGDAKNGRAFACINSNNKVVGHVAANFKSDIAWMINGYLDPEYRGQGIMRKLYGLARDYYPLAATAANNFGLSMYRNMGWIRYHDLVRYVKINPEVSNITIDNVCKPVIVNVEDYLFNQTHYFKQPYLKGIKLNEDSLAVSQEDVGGLRIIDLGNIVQAEKRAWELGYYWADYITSWNDLKIKELEKNAWILDYKSIVPWKLDPIEENYFSDITFLSEKPLEKNFIVHRSFSDHGRVGSII